MEPMKVFFANEVVIFTGQESSVPMTGLAEKSYTSPMNFRLKITLLVWLMVPKSSLHKCKVPVRDCEAVKDHFKVLPLLYPESKVYYSELRAEGVALTRSKRLGPLG